MSYKQQEPTRGDWSWRSIYIYPHALYQLVALPERGAHAQLLVNPGEVCQSTGRSRNRNRSPPVLGLGRLEDCLIDGASK